MSTFTTKILVATDGSEDAALAARATVDLVAETEAKLHLVHVAPSQAYPPPTRSPLLPAAPNGSARRKPERYSTTR